MFMFSTFCYCVFLCTILINLCIELSSVQLENFNGVDVFILAKKQLLWLYAKTHYLVVNSFSKFLSFFIGNMSFLMGPWLFASVDYFKIQLFVLWLPLT